jgi:hypothetical protein
MMIRKEAFADTRTFVFDRARPLDQARFQYLFEAGSADNVLRALAEFQNDDGGFGHGLEADVRAVASAAVATQIAFEIFRETRTPADHPMVARAVAYLVNTYDRQRQIWEIVPPEVESAPHAPWWTYANIMTEFGGCRLNPMPALVGALLDYPALVPSSLLEETVEVVLARLRGGEDKVTGESIRCVVSLAEAEHLPEAARSQVRAHALAAARDLVELDPARWGEYRLQPLDVLNSPHSFLAGAIDAAAVARNLDYWIEHQQPDGGWALTWSWADVDVEAWSQAEVDWRGYVAVNRLATLRAFERIDG